MGEWGRYGKCRQKLFPGAETRDIALGASPRLIVLVDFLVLGGRNTGHLVLGGRRRKVNKQTKQTNNKKKKKKKN
jgi:hypothetical protein